MIAVDVPEAIGIEEVQIAELPSGWRRWSAPKLQAFGEKWLKDGYAAVLRVPSVVVPLEYNYLLNPCHRDFGRLYADDPEPFEIDKRLLGSAPYDSISFGSGGLPAGTV